MLNKNYFSNIKLKDRLFYKRPNFKNNDNYRKKFIDKRSKKRQKNNSEFKQSKGLKSKCNKGKQDDMK